MRSPRYGLVRATRAIGLGEEGTYQNHRGAQATRQFGEVCVSVLKNLSVNTGWALWA